MPPVIQNRGELLSGAQGLPEARAREILLDTLEHALTAVEPVALVKSRVRVEDDWLRVGTKRYHLKGFRRIYVVGGGKAGAGMACAIEELLEDKIHAGVVNIPRGVKIQKRPKRIEMVEAGHPIPDEAGLRGVQKMLRLLEDTRKNDLVICLISGGGSALMPLPAPGLRLEDKQLITRMLLDVGATINELNIVRKHLSGIKGGRLAEAAHPAQVLALIISDVVGDPLGTIASGPCAPDPTTFRDAIGVLRKYGLWRKAPHGVRRVLSEGLDGEVPETPKPGAPVFKRVETAIVGNNMTACAAAEEKLRGIGFNTLILTTRLQGEARQAGAFLSSVVHEADVSGRPIARPAALICGGETTVRVTGKGTGGRNQELMLSVALQTAGLTRFAAVSMGTDGVDGSSRAAGAIVDSTTIARSRARRLDLRGFLGENNSYAVFSSLGDALVTGPTGTNCNDITLFLLMGGLPVRN